ncbi:MAG TPA: type II secretion system protein GspG [Moraxellaceae bacterium]|nr:type II secretion system protein GspG [Moraxellaceae bacterium]
MTTPQRHNHKRSGFTLLELLVVLIIIGLLAGIVGPNLFKHVGQSEVTTAKAQMDMLGKALDAYRLDVGQYPSTNQGLAALTQAPADAQRWHGPYLKKAAPLDPWGNAYVYRQPGADMHDYEIISLGKDGATGGTEENADLVSW